MMITIVGKISPPMATVLVAEGGAAGVGAAAAVVAEGDGKSDFPTYAKDNRGIATIDLCKMEVVPRTAAKVGVEEERGGSNRKNLATPGGEAVCRTGSEGMVGEDRTSVEGHSVTRLAMSGGTKTMTIWLGVELRFPVR